MLLSMFVDTQVPINHYLRRSCQLWAYFGSWEAHHCRQFVAFIPAFPIFGVIASHIILLIQCHAVWNRNKLVLILLVPLIFTETVIMSISSFTQIGRKHPCHLVICI